MSFRMYVTRTDGKIMQIFGNNDVPSEIIDELHKQGLPEFEDCFDEFEIKELQPVVDVMKNDLVTRFNWYEENKESYQLLNEKDINSLFDFTNKITDTNGLIDVSHLYIRTRAIIENSWLFHFYNFIEFLKADIDWKKSKVSKDLYVLKDDAHVFFDFG